MPRLDLSSRRVLKTDTRMIVSRRWRFDNLACVLAFPADPSEFQSDLVWVEDVAHKQRRQPAVAGPDGVMPFVDFRMRGTLQWDIAIRVWRVLNGYLEDSQADKIINPRQRRLETAHYKSRIERELLAWHVLADPTVLTQGTTLGAGERFDDISSINSDPLAVITYGCRQVLRKTGKRVDLGLFPAPIVDKLRIHERLMNYAVSYLNLSKDRIIQEGPLRILEAMIGEELVAPGAFKVYNATFNNSIDSPYATEQEDLTYFCGPNVVLMATATPGGEGGIEYGLGLGKYLSILQGTMGNDATVQIATGNDGYGVYNFPDQGNIAGGGDLIQLVDAWSPFVIKPEAGYLISSAADPARPEYEGSLDFTP